MVALLSGCAHFPEGPIGAGDSLPMLLRTQDVQAATAPSTRPLVTHFWALWCAPCMRELPASVELARQANAKGYDVLFVNVDAADRRDTVLSELRRLNAFGVARYVQLSRSVSVKTVTDLFDSEWSGALPATFGLTPQRKVVFARKGPMQAGDEAQLLEALGH